MYTCLSGRVLKIVENTAECVIAQDCDRKRVAAKGQVCYEPVCPENLVYDKGQKLCVEDCGDRPKYKMNGETLCQNACPEGVPYVFKGWCKKRCPVGSFTTPGNFTC